MTGFASPPARSRDGRSHVSIRGKLFGAFAGVASLTLVAGVVAFFSYGHIGRSLHQIEAEGIPAVDRAFTLARQAAELSAISSALVAANDQAALAAATQRLQAKRQEIGATLDALAAASADRALVESIKAHVDELEITSGRLSVSIASRLEATAERQRSANGAVAAHDDLISTLAPLVDDAGFDLASGLQSFDGREDKDALVRLLAKLSDVDAPAYQALTDLRDDANLILGVLTEVSLTPNVDLLPPLRDRFTARTYSARKIVMGLRDDDATHKLRPALAALLAYGRPGGVFEARSDELALTEQGWRLAADTQSEAAILAVEVQQFVKLAQRISSGAVAASGDAIGQSQAVLLGLTILSLASALAITWGYVGNGLLRRLDGLNRAMLALAAGDLGVAIPREGKDEIDRMAMAVEVFKQNAIRKKELEAEKERDRVEDLKRREASFRLLFESNPLPMWVHSADTLGFLSVNDAAVAHYGYGREQFLSMSAPDVCPAEDRGAFVEFLRDAPRSREGKAEETWSQLRGDGSRFEVSAFSRALPYEGRAAALVAVIDVTERKKAQASVVHMANHDALTGLPTASSSGRGWRRRWRGCGGRITASPSLPRPRPLQGGQRHARPPGWRRAAAGGRRAAPSLRPRDRHRLAASAATSSPSSRTRLRSPEEASAFATRLLETIGQAVSTSTGTVVVVNVSVGIALAPGDGADPDSLLKNADMALYRAKDEGRGAYRFFEPEMDARLQARRVLELDLRAALQRRRVRAPLPAAGRSALRRGPAASRR